MQGFGAVAVLNLAVMTNNVGGVCLYLLVNNPILTYIFQRSKQVIASSLVFMYVFVAHKSPYLTFCY